MFEPRLAAGAEAGRDLQEVSNRLFAGRRLLRSRHQPEREEQDRGQHDAYFTFFVAAPVKT